MRLSWVSTKTTLSLGIKDDMMEKYGEKSTGARESSIEGGEKENKKVFIKELIF